MINASSRSQRVGTRRQWREPFCSPLWDLESGFDQLGLRNLKSLCNALHEHRDPDFDFTQHIDPYIIQATKITQLRFSPHQTAFIRPFVSLGRFCHSAGALKQPLVSDMPGHGRPPRRRRRPPTGSESSPSTEPSF